MRFAFSDDQLNTISATMYDDPAMTRDMGGRARLVARQYDRKVAVQAYHDLFERVVARARAA